MMTPAATVPANDTSPLPHLKKAATNGYAPCRRRPEPASFLKKLRCILLKEDPSIISWSEDGRITVGDPVSLSNGVLHRYFRHNQFSSFQRQLNYFGYYKISGKGKMHRCVYTNDALPVDRNGKPGVTVTSRVTSTGPVRNTTHAASQAPPYPVDALLKLKRKSAHDKPSEKAAGNRTIGQPVEDIDSFTLKESRVASKAASHSSAPSVVELAHARATLMCERPRYMGVHQISSSDLSSTTEIFDWAEPIDASEWNEGADDDVSPRDYVALLSDDSEETQGPHRYFSPVLLDPAEGRGLSDGRGAEAAQDCEKGRGHDDIKFTDLSLQTIHHNPQMFSWLNGDESSFIPNTRGQGQRAMSWPLTAISKFVASGNPHVTKQEHEQLGHLNAARNSITHCSIEPLQDVPTADQRYNHGNEKGIFDQHPREYRQRPLTDIVSPCEEAGRDNLMPLPGESTTPRPQPSASSRSNCFSLHKDIQAMQFPASIALPDLDLEPSYDVQKSVRQ